MRWFTLGIGVAWAVRLYDESPFHADKARDANCGFLSQKRFRLNDFHAGVKSMRPHRCDRGAQKHLGILRAGAIVGLLFALSLVALSQSTTSLYGIVKDPSGAVVPLAGVKLLNPETQIQRQTST